MSLLFLMSREEYLQEFDELHLLAAEIITDAPGTAVSKVEELLIHAYLLGRKHTCDELDEADWAYYEDLLSEKEQAERMADAIYKRYDGKDFEDKVREYVPVGMAVILYTFFFRISVKGIFWSRPLSTSSTASQTYSPLT